MENRSRQEMRQDSQQVPVTKKPNWDQPCVELLCMLPAGKGAPRQRFRISMGTVLVCKQARVHLLSDKQTRSHNILPLLPAQTEETSSCAHQWFSISVDYSVLSFTVSVLCNISQPSSHSWQVRTALLFRGSWRSSHNTIPKSFSLPPTLPYC